MFGLEGAQSILTIGEMPAFRMGAMSAQVLATETNHFEVGTEDWLLFGLGFSTQRSFDNIQRAQREAELWR